MCLVRQILNTMDDFYFVKANEENKFIFLCRCCKCHFFRRKEEQQTQFVLTILKFARSYRSTAISYEKISAFFINIYIYIECFSVCLFGCLVFVRICLWMCSCALSRVNPFKKKQCKLISKERKRKLWEKQVDSTGDVLMFLFLLLLLLFRVEQSHEKKKRNKFKSIA